MEGGIRGTEAAGPLLAQLLSDDDLYDCGPEGHTGGRGVHGPYAAHGGDNLQACAPGDGSSHGPVSRRFALASVQKSHADRKAGRRYDLTGGPSWVV